MKNIRQQKILDLIAQNIITTQDDLQEQLEALGFKVTQSTVSRDIKDLRIVKSQDKDGVYRYLVAEKNSESRRDRNHFEEVFSRACVGVTYSLNTVVIKCYSGMASGACVAVDHLFSDMVLGSLAGDDTILAITAGERESIVLTERLKKLI